MSLHHKVEQGEHLAGIAKKYGFVSYKTIWDHAQNAKLKQQRENPNVLFPGDTVFIPDKQQKVEQRDTDKRHRFVVKQEKIELRIVLEDLYEKPIANATCKLNLGNRVIPLTTDGDGKFVQTIDATEKRALLVIHDQETPLDKLVIPILIGHLDPVDEVSGQITRLNNLGYSVWPASTEDEEEKQKALQSAVEEFQCDHGLAVSGDCGPVTQSKLKEVHGC